MRETAASSWSEFSPWLDRLEQARADLRGSSGMYVSDFVYRGQASADWKLETTLERAYPKALRVKDYYAAAHAAKHQIEAHTGRAWAIPSPTDYDSWVDIQRMYGTDHIPGLEYLAYLRHHGFPSPFLDWSQSAYVAAYFALSQAASDADRVAVYAYLEFAGGGKEGSSDLPVIRTIGSYIPTHRRHFLQQSEYTVCTVRDGEEWSYANHEAAFEVVRDDRRGQDLLWKLTLPVSERAVGLRYLDKFNLNAFSLFGSEESLMQTLAFRELPQ